MAARMTSVEDPPVQEPEREEDIKHAYPALGIDYKACNFVLNNILVCTEYTNGR
jgi:hypothetical protein